MHENFSKMTQAQKERAEKIFNLALDIVVVATKDDPEPSIVLNAMASASASLLMALGLDRGLSQEEIQARMREYEKAIQQHYQCLTPQGDYYEANF